MPTSGQNAVGWRREASSLIFSGIGVAGVGTPETGVDVGTVMLTVVFAAAAFTPLFKRYEVVVATAAVMAADGPALMLRLSESEPARSAASAAFCSCASSITIDAYSSPLPDSTSLTTTNTPK